MATNVMDAGEPTTGFDADAHRMGVHMGAPGAHRRRIRSAVLGIVAGSMIFTPVASADPPKPTNYRSEIIGVTPQTDSISVAIVGGDAFLELKVVPGHTAEVRGYEDEPYLRFRADGIVEENRNSSTFEMNLTRYGSDHTHRSDEGEAPRWVQVSTSGTYAWHDHRIHWMGNIAPPDKAPGDVILRATVPITVDSAQISIGIRSTWMRPPSPVPTVLGMLVGVALAAAALGSSRRLLQPILLAVATAALATGLTHTFSVPRSVGMPWDLWALPALAASFGAAALLRGRHPAIGRGAARARSSGLIDNARLLEAFAAVELAVWSYRLFPSWSASILPTVAPAVLVRGIVGCTAVFSIAICGFLITSSIVRPLQPFGVKPRFSGETDNQHESISL